MDDPISGKMYTNQFEYDIVGPGTYAVIFMPKMTPNLIPTAFCGLVCKYKKEVIAFSFFVLPIIFLILGVIFKYMMLQYSQLDTQRELKFTRQRLKEMEKVTAAFRGQSLKEKITDNMEY